MSASSLAAYLHFVILSVMPMVNTEPVRYAMDMIGDLHASRCRRATTDTVSIGATPSKAIGNGIFKSPASPTGYLPSLKPRRPKKGTTRYDMILWVVELSQISSLISAIDTKYVVGHG